MSKDNIANDILLEQKYLKNRKTNNFISNLNDYIPIEEQKLNVDKIEKLK